jgi:hypothetical protein
MERNGPRDKFPSKPKQMQAMEATLVPKKLQTGAPLKEINIEVMHQLLEGQL